MKQTTAEKSEQVFDGMEKFWVMRLIDLMPTYSALAFQLACSKRIIQPSGHVNYSNLKWLPIDALEAGFEVALYPEIITIPLSR